MREPRFQAKPRFVLAVISSAAVGVDWGISLLQAMSANPMRSTTDIAGIDLNPRIGNHVYSAGMVNVLRKAIKASCSCCGNPRKRFRAPLADPPCALIASEMSVARP